MTQPTKKQKRLTKYSLEYRKDYPFIKACYSSLKDHLYKFHCSSCNVNISCAHGGDVREHIATSNHKTAHRNCQSKFNLHGHVVLEVISNIYHQQLLGSLGGSKNVQTLSLRNLISLKIYNL